MKMTNKRRTALAGLDAYIQESPMCQKNYTDAAFYRSTGRSKNVYEGEAVNGETAFFYKTDLGKDVPRQLCKNFERYKQLVIAHRLKTLTATMIAEGLEEGLISPDEL